MPANHECQLGGCSRRRLLLGGHSGHSGHQRLQRTPAAARRLQWTPAASGRPWWTPAAAGWLQRTPAAAGQVQVSRPWCPGCCWTSEPGCEPSRNHASSWAGADRQVWVAWVSLDLGAWLPAQNKPWLRLRWCRFAGLGGQGVAGLESPAASPKEAVVSAGQALWEPTFPCLVWCFSTNILHA